MRNAGALRDGRFPMSKRPPKPSAKSPPAASRKAALVERPWFLAGLLAAVTLAVFWPAGGFAFINCDDPEYFTNNPHVQAGLGWAQIKWAFTTGYFGNWLPLTWLSLMLDVSLFGTGPAAPHLVNVLLHAANTVLVFAWLRRMTGAHWRSALVAALFALHPLHVESVAWVAERRDVLSSFFGLLSLYFYARYVQSPIGNRQWATGNYLFCLAFFICSLMSKAMLVTLPFALLLLDCWPLGRVAGFPVPGSGFPAAETGTRSRNVGGVLLEKIPFLMLGVAVSAVTSLLQNQAGALSGLARLPLQARVENAFVSYARYLGKTFWPAHLALPYPHPGHWPSGWVIFSALLVLALSLAAVWLGRRRPFVFAGWFWFFGMLVPAIGLVQVGAQAMADRFTYLPLLGIFWLLVWAAGAWVTARRVPRLAAGALAVLVLGACAWQTRAQLAYWRNSGILFQHAVDVIPDNYLGHNSLGAWLAEQGRLDEAIAQYRAALALRPDHEQALNNLGNALVKQGQVAEGIDCFQKALLQLPDSPEVHNNLGNALVRQGKFGEAETQFRLAITNNPDFADAHNDWGNTLAMQGKFAEAEAEFREAMRCQPKSPDARYNLGNTLALQGKFAEAIEQYAGVLQLNPDYPQAQLNWGSALLRLNRRDEAVTHLREALRLKPGYAEAIQQLQQLGVPVTP
jgi:protein O-mannosyl-transferase